MSEFHLKHIKAVLEREIAPLIDKEDLKAFPVDDQANHVLSRSLAAYALCLSAEIGPELAASHVTDGYQDHGIDAFYFDPGEHRVYVVQSKWSHNADKGLKASDIRTFTDGFRELLDGDFRTFNDRFKALELELNTAIADAGATFTLILAYSGAGALSADVQEHMQRFLEDLNDAKETFSLSVLSQTALHDAVAKRAEGAPVILQEVLLHEWSCIREPYVAYQGQVPAADVARWHEQHKEKLFRKNLRHIIPASDVNAAMAATLETEPEHFWYFNNGITIICDSIKPRAKGGGTSRAPKSLSCTGVNIVNGAQTVGAIAIANSKKPESLQDAWVSVRLVSLEDCPAGFAEAVTRATNTQNSITNRDFAALDEHQRRLRRDLRMEAREYAIRTGEVDVPPSAERGCTIDEATIALACERDIALAVVAKSTPGRVWENTSRAPYTYLFNANLTAQHLWKTVEVLRAVDAALLQEQATRVGREKQAAIHGNRFIAHQVFKRLHAFHGSFDALPKPDLEHQVAALTVESLDAAFAALEAKFRGAYLQTFFKSREKCRVLDDEIKNPQKSALPPPGANLTFWKK
jgi:hypothetical protein